MRSAFLVAVLAAPLLATPALAQDGPLPPPDDLPGPRITLKPALPRGGGSFTFDDDEDEVRRSPALPWNPFDRGETGDWSAYVWTEIEKGATTKRAVSVDIAEVASNTGSVKTVTTVSSPTRADHLIEASFDRKKAPPIRSLFQDVFNVELATLSDVKVETATLKLDGKIFDCKKVSFTSTRDDEKTRCTLWLSRDAKGPGLVRFRSDGRTIELAGFGMKKTLLWGKTGVDLTKQLEKAPR